MKVDTEAENVSLDVAREPGLGEEANFEIGDYPMKAPNRVRQADAEKPAGPSGGFPERQSTVQDPLYAFTPEDREAMQPFPADELAQIIADRVAFQDARYRDDMAAGRRLPPGITPYLKRHGIKGE